MKAHRCPTEFKPVIVTLESQAEVDALYALLNHTKIVECVPPLGGAWEELENFAKSSYVNYHHALNEKIKT